MEAAVALARIDRGSLSVLAARLAVPPR